jgi:hypothetical protein
VKIYFCPHIAESANIADCFCEKTVCDIANITFGPNNSASSVVMFLNNPQYDIFIFFIANQNGIQDKIIML